MLGLPMVQLGERTWTGCKDVGRRIGSRIVDARARARARRRRLRPTLSEVLEERQLLSAAGVDYVISGYKWSDPSRITYSIAPDGVSWISGTNTISSAFDAKFGAGTWRRELARALATWQTAANINIVPVADGPYGQNALGAWQGDPRFGDIRIGGVAMGEQKILAQTYYPPPNGSTSGGDVEINLTMDYGIGRQYDLFSVLLHETGHSLGLGHPTDSSHVMRSVYGGVVTTLSDGDLEGIRAIYGARKVDVYEAQGYGKSAALPIDMTGPLATSNTFTSEAASLDVIGETQWFSFIAPSYAAGTWSVTASASNLSMLSPKVTLHDDSGRVLATASDPGKWSADATARTSSLVPGRRYYAAVTGATNDVFAVGTYNLTISVSGTPAPPPPPVVVPPTVPTAPTVPTMPNIPVPIPPVAPIPPATGPIYPTTTVVLPDVFEQNDTARTATRLGRVTRQIYYGLTLTTGDVDFHAFQAAVAGVYHVSAPGTIVQIYNNRGRVVAQGNGAASVSATRNASFTVLIQAPSAAPVAGYNMTIAAATQAPARVPPGRAPLPPARRPPFGRMPPLRQTAPMLASAAWESALRRAPA